MELYLHSPIRNHDVQREKFTFTFPKESNGKRQVTLLRGREFEMISLENI